MPVLAELQQDFTLAAPSRWTPVVAVAAARLFKLFVAVTAGGHGCI